VTRQDAARSAFLLNTPAILAAGVLKLPDLFGSDSHGIRGPILIGSIITGSAPTCRLTTQARLIGRAHLRQEPRPLGERPGLLG